MKALVIVDPQNDFITGTLLVQGASQAMNRVAKALPTMACDQIFITMDAHPMNHCSFISQGGAWPIHCVKYSQGAAIWEPLMQALQEVREPVTFIEKGCARDKDEYSAFEHSYPSELDEADELLLCGIAGNVCVLNTLKDLANHGLAPKISVILDASPSLDDGTALLELIAQTGVKTKTLHTK